MTTIGAWIRRKKPKFQPIGIDHLLLVAGPSGSGKSSFLRALAEDRLPSEIGARLPDGARHWLQTNGDKVICPASGLWSGPASVVMHYDILRPFGGILEGGYESDPTLEVVRQAKKVTVVSIRTPSAQLMRQLDERISLSRVPPIARNVARKFRFASSIPIVPEWVTKTHELLSPRARARSNWTRRHRMIWALYSRDDWVEDWYGRWEAYIGSAVIGRVAIPPIVVEPASCGDGLETFRACERPEFVLGRVVNG